MKLQQLRYLLEIERQHFNISRAANVLCTSQSGISKQIHLLEDELQVELFERHGKKLISFSPAGLKVMQLATEILNKVDDIKHTTEEFTDKQRSIAIATTHTQARYILPVIVEQFLTRYPDINLNIQQGSPTQVAELLEQGSVDIAIATEVLASCETLIALPCYQWSRSVITKKNHPLASGGKLTLQQIAHYPMITYVHGFTGRYKQDEAFNKHQLQPNIVLTAVDADVIKTYVRLGLGVGIIADMAFNQQQDHDLLALSAEHLFGLSTSLIAIKKDRHIKAFVYAFIELFAPHLNIELIRQVQSCQDWKSRNKLLSNLSIPKYRLY